MVTMAATGQMDAFRRGYVKSTRYLALVLLPAAGLLLLFADRILLYWLGPVMANQSTTVLRLLVCAYVLQALSSTSSIAVDALGRPGIQTAFYGISCVTNFVLIVLLTPVYGITGAAAAFLLNTVVQNGLFMIYVSRRVVQVSLLHVLHAGYGRPAVAVLGAMVAAVLCRTALGDALVGVAAAAMVYLLCCAILLLKLGAVQRDEVIGFRKWTAVKLARTGSVAGGG
jgi:O-antigen/teichoic acid export membrane protein